jgi:hypothetical protein
MRVLQKEPGMPKKEKITPPSKKTLKKASEELRKGGSLGGRVESEEAAAKRQGATRKGQRKK